jgi:protein involved in sex pheromone biosynthesis
MKRLIFILTLGVMFMLGACGSKSTTNEETDVEVVNGGGSAVPVDGVEELDTENEVFE